MEVVRREPSRIVAERAVDDTHLHYLDGRRLYGTADHDRRPLPDRLHPDAVTHRLIANRFADLVFGFGAPFAVQPSTSGTTAAP